MDGSLFSNGALSFHCKKLSRFYFPASSLKFRPELISAFSLIFFELPQMVSRGNHQTRICAVRRRRSYFQSDTYVLLEPGKSEEFVSEEELRVRLKGWLQNWPGNNLPPDLARFRTIDDAVSHLVRSVCELEIDGDVGSIQWYQVRLE